MVTEQQLSFWKTFGYLVFRDVFPDDEIDQISLDMDEVMEERRQGQPFTGEDTDGAVVCRATAVAGTAGRGRPHL